MALRARAVVSLTLLGGLVVALGGCSILDSLGLGATTDQAATPEVSSEPSAPEGSSAEEAQELEEVTVAPEGLTVPPCESLYSPVQTAALLEEVRVNMGDTSEGVVGFGTTNPELVAILSAIRSDVRISCTWYLPASESVSVTSIAIIGGDATDTVTGLLNGLDTARSSTGGGTLWTLDQAAAGESPDFMVTESHFVVATPCPSALAEETCAVWVSTNYTFGAAEALTLDAASHLGVFAP